MEFVKGELTLAHMAACEAENPLFCPQTPAEHRAVEKAMEFAGCMVPLMKDPAIADIDPELKAEICAEETGFGREEFGALIDMGLRAGVVKPRR